MTKPLRLREAHAHIFQHGRGLMMVDLSACTGPGDVVERVRERAARGDRVILGHGARPEAWAERRWPTLAELDEAAGDGLCCLWCFDYHALMASSRTIHRAGIESRTPNPAGGIIERSRAGELTGVMYERAAQMVWESLPEPEEIQRHAMVRDAISDLARRHGFSEVHDLKAQPWLGKVLADLEASGELEASCVIWPLVEHVEQVASTRALWESDRVRLGGGKIFVDGTLNSRTAWMLEPYADGRADHPNGLAMMSRDDIERAVRACDALGLPMAAHAIGDAAVRAVLDAIEVVKPRASGFRIEHCEIIDEADVGRFAGLGVIASVQPCHLLYDTEVLRRALPNRLDRVMPLRSLIGAGCEPGVGLIFGSDTPIVRPDPRDSIDAATLRRRTGEAGSGIGMAEAISEAEAWACFASATSGGR